MDGAGVVALAVAADACRHCKQTYCGAELVVRRSCFAACWRRSLGAMVGGMGYCIVYGMRQISSRVAVREEQVNASQSSGAAAIRSPLAFGGVKSQERWTEQLRHSRLWLKAPQFALSSSHQCGGDEESMVSIVECELVYCNTLDTSSVRPMSKTSLLQTWITGTYFCS